MSCFAFCFLSPFWCSSLVVVFVLHFSFVPPFSLFVVMYSGFSLIFSSDPLILFSSSRLLSSPPLILLFRYSCSSSSSDNCFFFIHSSLPFPFIYSILSSSVIWIMFFYICHISFFLLFSHYFPFCVLHSLLSTVSFYFFYLSVVSLSHHSILCSHLFLSSYSSFSIHSHCPLLLVPITSFSHL